MIPRNIAIILKAGSSNSFIADRGVFGCKKELPWQPLSISAQFAQALIEHMTICYLYMES